MNSESAKIVKLKTFEPMILPNPALKLPFLHNVRVETTSGKEVAIAKNRDPATVADKLSSSAKISVA